MNTRDLDRLRLAYAQHVYKAQGLTADRALVLTGGWHTDRERAYVALTRARERTDVYASRDDLGQQGIDSDAIGRLAERMSESGAQHASITRAQRESAQAERAGAPFAERLRAALDQRREPATDRSRERDPADAQRSRFAQELHEALNYSSAHELDHDRGGDIEI
jgi:hypothetical protein